MKKNNGFVGVDMVIAILAIITFSTFLISLMYNNFLENLKLKKEALATIYLTEALENVGIINFDALTQENIDNGAINVVPSEIVKKVKATISYTAGNKNYQYIMERAKIKE